MHLLLLDQVDTRMAKLFSCVDVWYWGFNSFRPSDAYTRQ